MFVVNYICHGWTGKGTQRRGKWKKIIIGKHNTQMSLIWVIVTVMIIKILIMIVMSQRGDRCAIACACSFSTLLSIRGVFI